MHIKITDKAGVSYEKAAGITRRLPYQWAGYVSAKIAKKMIKAGSAESLADVKTQETDDTTSNKLVGKTADENVDKIYTLSVEIADLKDDKSVLLADLETWKAKTKVLLVLSVGGLGADEKLVGQLLETPADRGLLDTIVDLAISARENIPSGIKPDQAVVKESAPPTTSDSEEALLVKYKKFPKKTIVDMLVADNIEFDAAASRDILAAVLAKAHSQ